MRPSQPRSSPFRTLTTFLKRERSGWTADVLTEFHAFDFLLPSLSNPSTDRFFWPSYQHVSHYKLAKPPSPKSDARYRSANSVCITFLARPADKPPFHFARSVSSAVARLEAPHTLPLGPQDLRIAWQEHERCAGRPDALAIQKKLLETALKHVDELSQEWQDRIASLLDACCDSKTNAALWLRFCLTTQHPSVSGATLRHVLCNLFSPSDPTDPTWASEAADVLQAAITHRPLESVVELLVLPYRNACEHLLFADPATPATASLRSKLTNTLRHAMRESTMDGFLSWLQTSYKDSGLPLLCFKVLLADCANPVWPGQEQLARLPLVLHLFWSSEECRRDEQAAAQLAKILWRRNRLEQAWAVRRSILHLGPSLDFSKRICDRIRVAALKARQRPRNQSQPPNPAEANAQASWSQVKSLSNQLFLQRYQLGPDIMAASWSKRQQALFYCLQQGRTDAAVGFLVDLFPLKRSLGIYQIALYHLARLADSRFHLLWQETADTFPLDSKTYNALFLYLSKRRDEQAALTLYHELERKGQVNEKILATLLSVLIKNKCWDIVRKVWQATVAKTDRPFPLDIGLYNIRLQALLQMGAPMQEVDNLLGDMSDAGLEADQYTVALMLETLCRSNRLAAAESLFDGIYEPTVYHFGIMSKIAYSQDNQDLAQTYIERMMDLGIRPNTVIMAQSIVAELAAGQWQQAAELADSYVRSRVESHNGPASSAVTGKELNDIYAPFMSPKFRANLRTRRRKVRTALNRLQENGTELSYITKVANLQYAASQNDAQNLIDEFNNLLADFRTSQTLSGASALHTGARSTRINVALSILIEGLARRGRYRSIASVWTSLFTEGFRADGGSWNALCVALLDSKSARQGLWIAEYILAASPSRRAAHIPLVPLLLEGIPNKRTPRRRPNAPAGVDRPFRFRGADHNVHLLSRRTIQAIRDRVPAMSYEFDSSDRFRKLFPSIYASIGHPVWDTDHIVRLLHKESFNAYKVPSNEWGSCLGLGGCAGVEIGEW